MLLLSSLVNATEVNLSCEGNLTESVQRDNNPKTQFTRPFQTSIIVDFERKYIQVPSMSARWCDENESNCKCVYDGKQEIFCFKHSQSSADGSIQSFIGNRSRITLNRVTGNVNIQNESVNNVFAKVETNDVELKCVKNNARKF